MNNLKKTLFISDLHLNESDAGSMAQFTSLVNKLDSQVDALYILGDFFETWIGDDDQTPFNETVIALLKSVRNKSIPVYFMHGNRDFLVGKTFLDQTGCQFLPDETCITIYGTRILLMHGDTLCTADAPYQRARKFMRNRFLQWLFSCLPLAWRRKVADNMRDASKEYTTAKSADMMDVVQKDVIRVMQKNDARFLIHGHTHKPAFHQFSINDEAYMRIVLGAWHHQGSVLIWHENGNKELISL